MNCTRTQLLAAGLALAIVAAAIGWTLYLRERERAHALAARIASMEPDVTAFRQNLEDDKAGRAKLEMRAIEQTYKKY